MPPLLHVMRHGQGYHSPAVTKDGAMLRDPSLTELGKEQCRKRSIAFGRQDQIQLLLASPLRRALQTCQLAFAPCLDRGLVIVALPHAEEFSSAPSDTGSPISNLKAEFPDVDFEHLSEGWFRHEGEFASEPKAVLERARKLRRWIKARPEREIALVSHGFFNHFLTGDVDELGAQTTPWWNEAELRTYTFSDEDDDMAMIYETDGSLHARGGLTEDGSNRFITVNDPASRGKPNN